MSSTKNGSIIVMMKELKLLFKSKRRIGLLVMIPIIILITGVIIAFTAATVDDQVEPTNVWVINDSPGQYSGDLIALWGVINDTEIEEVAINKTAVLESMDFDVLVHIPSNFTTLVQNNETAVIQIAYNGNETVHQSVAYSILQLTEIYEANLILSQNPDIEFERISSQLTEISEEEEGIDEELGILIVIIPVYIIFFVVIPPISLVLISVTIEREQKTLEVLFLQPVRRRSIMLGKILYGLAIVLITLVLDIIAILISVLLFRLLSSEPTGESSELTDLLSDILTPEALVMFMLGILLISVNIIALSVLMSLLAKDEREANMISGILPLLIMFMVLIVILVPIEEQGLVGQALWSISPLMGVIVSIYLTAITGKVVIWTYISLIAQVVWAFIIVGATARISEAESILELTYTKAFSELKRFFTRKKVLIKQ